jgi:serine/threonine protein phosphatase 1
MLRKILNWKVRREPPRVPHGVRAYAIGDIHGRADLLQDLFARIDSDLAHRKAERSIEIYLGDYIDRGPASRDVIESLISRSQSREIVCLKGNHESYPTRFVHSPETLREWAQLGGIQTLMSYGLRLSPNLKVREQHAVASAFRAALPPTHLGFLEGLRTFFICGDFYFVHAGVRPGVALRDQAEEDLLWIRDEFLECEDDFGKIIVHGHTPVLAPDFRPNRINIDTGAYATGRLTCLVIEGDRISLL